LKDYLIKFLKTFGEGFRFFVQFVRDSSSKRDLSKEETNNQRYRSHSLDRVHSSKSKPIEDNSPSGIRKQWICQLCQSPNPSNSQLCYHCGTSQINIYIPIMDHNEKTTNENSHQDDSLNKNR
jgi:hypothetical protein